MAERVVPHVSALQSGALNPPYSQAIRLWGIFFALAAFVLDQTFLEMPYKALLIDFFCIGLLGLVAAIALRTIVLRRRPVTSRLITIPQISRTLPSLPHIILAAASLVFLLLWLSRWLEGWDAGIHPKVRVRYENFLHAGLLLALTVFVMASQKVRSWWEAIELTPGRLILVTYVAAILTGTFLLILPVSLRPGVPITITDAFFTVVSAITVTGLVTVVVPDVFNLFGQTMILVLIQLGGLGLVMVSVGLAAITRERLSLSEALMGRELYDIPEVGRIRSFLLRVLACTAIVEALGSLWIFFSLPSGLEHRAFHAVFHSISAFCNAGFSTFGSNLTMPGLSMVRTAVAVLIVIGGIGFPVIFEILGRFRKEPRFRPWSAHSLITLVTTVILITAGATGIFLIQWLGGAGEWGEELGHAFFYSISARTAGYSSTEMSHLSMGAQLVMALLMMIGGAPLSTAGGIKVTTAAVLVISSISLLRGQKWIQFRRGEVSTLILQKAVTVVFLYLSFTFLGLITLIILEPVDPWRLTFEVISALSTVGLTIGVTPELTTPAKYVLAFLMLMGRLGVLTMVYIGVGSLSGQRYRYPKERFYVG